MWAGTDDREAARTAAAGSAMTIDFPGRRSIVQTHDPA
jgi:hypothetical protein